MSPPCACEGLGQGAEAHPDWGPESGIQPQQDNCGPLGGAHQDHPGGARLDREEARAPESG
eukprot:3375741-Prymnesium_polylepis.1